MKKFFRYTFIILCILFLFRGILYRYFVNYTVINTREAIPLTDLNLCNEIDHQILEKSLNIDEIIALCHSITSKKLKFTFKKTSSNPNIILKNKEANCIGYASLFNSIGNYMLQQKQLTNYYQFIHLVGKLDILGFDIHELIDHAFFKDHDFNRIKNLKTDGQIYVDSSLHDYVYIDEVTCKKL